MMIKKALHHLLSFFHWDMMRTAPLPRLSILEVKKQNKKDIMGVEIGVYRGDNSVSILKTLDIKKLYLIDPYEDYDDYTGKWWDKGYYVSLDNAKKKAIKKTEKYPDKVRWLFHKTEDCAKFIKEDLDFVYIDGNHTYQYVKKDIELMFPKLKKGGILCGHDISIPDIVQAVVDFIRDKPELKLVVMGTDWMVVK